MTGKQFLFIIAATCITAVAWAVFDIYHKESQVTIPAETQELIKPISPDFDTSGVK